MSPLNRSSFLWRKFSSIGLTGIFHNQIESLVLGLVMGVPSVLGMLIRNIVLRLWGMKIDGFCWIQHGVTVVSANRVRVGRNFGCNSGSYLNGTGGISMGNDVLIGSNVTISSGKHEIEGRATSIFSRPVCPLPIEIGNDVWIGAGAVILPGVKIADGTVIGANSVVTRNTEPYSVVAGAPARLIRYR